MNTNIIRKTRIFIKKYMDKLNDISHDYGHINHVIRLALKIAKKEGINNKEDLFYIKMGALLHDYEDSKYSNKSQSYMINEYLKKYHKSLKSYDRLKIVYLASNISLSKEIEDNNEINNEDDIKLSIIKDADRINSLGSIGIMRYISFNIINSNKPSFNEIISNMKKRTMKIKKYIRTKTGKQMANKHIKLMEKFIKNYELFL